MTVKQLGLVVVMMFAGAAMPAAADNAPAPGRESGWLPRAGDEIRFNVLRQGNAFGSHVVRFDEAEGGLVAKTDVSLRAGLGPITLFRYELNAQETWQDGKLVAVTGRVNDDGKRGTVTALRQGGALTVDGSAFKGNVPERAVPASHWNYAQTKTSQLLSTEDGEILDVTVIPKGREMIRAGGQQIEANRYLLDSDIDVHLWYDDDGRWVKLAFEARGQQIEYVLDRLY